MPLVNTLKVFFPETPEPPSEKVSEISAALDAAILVHVATAYVPAAFGSTFLAAVGSPTPFLVTLSSYLSAVMAPILTAALTAESTPGSNHLLAWGSVQSSFDAIAAITPPFMTGIDGLRLWQAIVLAIRLFLVPEFPPPPPPPSPEESSDGVIIILEEEI